jgi:hypothetical protein
MKYLFIILSVILVLIGAQALGAPTKIGDLQFADNFDSLMAQAQRSQKVVILDWFTDW